MNITPWMLYWITRLDGIQVLFGLMTVIAIVVMVFTAFCGYITLYNLDYFPCQDKEKCKDMARVLFKISKLTIIFLLIGILGIFIPSTKEMAAILIIPKIANSQTAEEMGKLPLKLTDLANQWIEELKPRKNEKAD